MASGRFPPWAVLRPIVGIVLSLMLVTLVVGRATGLIGDASGEATRTTDVAVRPAATGTATPSPVAEP